MRIVIDTNVLISGVFFGGFPRKVLSSVVAWETTACATAEIINEYAVIAQEMIDKKQGHISKNILTPLITAMEIIEPITLVKYSEILVTINFSVVQKIPVHCISLVATKTFLWLKNMRIFRS